MKITSIIIWLGLIATAVFIYIHGSPDSLMWWLIAFLLLALNSIPFIALYFCNRSCDSTLISRIIVLVGSIILTGAAIYFMYVRFLFDTELETGSVFLFTPLYLIAVVIFTILLAWLFNSKSNETAKNQQNVIYH